MRKLIGIVAVVVAIAAPGGGAAAADRGAFARAAATKLYAKKAIRPETHTTDFRGDSLGCITLTAWELRHFGFRGHAFFCEDAATGEVLGAVLSRGGFVRCFISGDYVGDGCYDFTICGVAEGACVVQ
jgi:hypothetical protein